MKYHLHHYLPQRAQQWPVLLFATAPLWTQTQLTVAYLVREVLLQLEAVRLEEQILPKELRVLASLLTPSGSR